MNREKMKVLFVITKSNWGGAQRYVYDLATGLSKDQFAVSIAFGKPGLLAEKLAHAGVQTFPIVALQRDLSLGADLRSFAELVRLFRHEHPDVVHLNSSKAGGLGALAARFASWRSRRPMRIVFTAHGWPFTERRNMLWRTFAFLGSWATALLAHTVIVVSKNDLALGKRLPFCAGKMRLVYNGIDLNMSLGSGERIRSAFPAGAYITGTVGELTHNKNHIMLVEEALENPGMCVAIVGEGEERANLEAAIRTYHLENRVKLFGFVPARDVLRGFDMFALPSLKEGLPYVLIEARAAGIPIRANRVGGVGEVLDAPDLSQFSLEHMLKKTEEAYL